MIDSLLHFFPPQSPFSIPSVCLSLPHSLTSTFLSLLWESKNGIVNITFNFGGVRFTVTSTSQVNEHLGFLRIRASERGSYSQDIHPRNIQAELTGCFPYAWEILVLSEIQLLRQSQSYQLKTEVPAAFGKMM